MLDHYGIVPKKKCANVRGKDACYYGCNLTLTVTSCSNLKLLCYFASVAIMKSNSGVKMSRLL